MRILSQKTGAKQRSEPVGGKVADISLTPLELIDRIATLIANYKDAEMALRWTAAGFIEAEKSFKKLRGYDSSNIPACV